MPKLSRVNLFAALLASVGLIGARARAAELEGALQYPTPSVGEDAQPPPARMVPQPVLTTSTAQDARRSVVPQTCTKYSGRH
jgi:hypothetical protein